MCCVPFGFARRLNMPRFGMRTIVGFAARRAKGSGSACGSQSRYPAENSSVPSLHGASQDNKKPQTCDTRPHASLSFRLSEGVGEARPLCSGPWGQEQSSLNPSWNDVRVLLWRYDPEKLVLIVKCTIGRIDTVELDQAISCGHCYRRSQGCEVVIHIRSIRMSRQ